MNNPILKTGMTDDQLDTSKNSKTSEQAKTEKQLTK